MPRYLFEIGMTYAECQDMYLQQIRYVVVRSHLGKTVRLPKENLRPFLLPSGIHGRFELITDDNNKIKSLKRLL
jgi:hypothetical protein